MKSEHGPYVSPCDVTSPKHRWTHKTTLRNVGAGDWAAAEGIWDGNPVVALRWNGCAEKKMGNPTSRRATWFIVPCELERAVREAAASTIHFPILLEGEITEEKAKRICDSVLEGYGAWDDGTRLFNPKVPNQYRVHLMLNISAGTLEGSIFLYGKLKHLRAHADMEITTHNIGSLAPLGLLPFCLGDKRFCVPEGRFGFPRFPSSFSRTNPEAWEELVSVFREKTDLNDAELKELLAGEHGGEIKSAIWAKRRRLVSEIRPPPEFRRDPLTF